MKLSGKDLRFFDEASKSHYTPILIESSAGMDRTTLTMLIDAYEREKSVDPNGKETERIVLRFHPLHRAGSSCGLFARAQQTGTRANARGRSKQACARYIARNTTKATSGNSTGVKTKSARHSA